MTGDIGLPAHQEPPPMTPLATNRTAARPLPPRRGIDRRCSFVEDLNWPAPDPVPGRKPTRPTDVWVPGPNGQWEGVPPTLQ